MAPYRYEPSFNAPAWVGSIADIIRRQGEIPAEAALRIGQLQGQGAQQSGLVYAAAINHVGGDVSNALLQATDPRRKLEALQLADAQRAQGARGVLAGAMSGDQANGPLQPGEVPAGNSYLKKEGDVSVWDVEGLSKALASQGYGDLAPAAVQGISQLNAAHRDESNARAAYQMAQTNVLAKGAGAALGVMRSHPEVDPKVIVDLIGTQMEQNGTYPPDQIAQVKAGLLSDPSSIQAKLEALSKQGTAKPEAVAKDTILVNPNDPGGPPLVSNLVPEKPTEASIALEAAGGDAGGAMALLKPKPEKPPLPIEQQLLQAIASGDTKTRDQIIATEQASAAAKRDPVALAQLAETRKLTQEAAKARLDALAEKNKPLDIAPDIQTSRTGHQFVDLSLYGVGERDRAREAANKAGAIPVSKETASGLQDLDTARANQADILAQIQDLLPKTAVGRLGSKLTVPLERIFQTNDQIAAFNTWRTSAIQTMRATAGSKGLRINRSEIDMAIQNDIPNLTDTLGTAQQKIANINKMLDNIENSSLVRDRSALVPEKPPTGPPEPASLSAPPGIQGLRNR